MVARGLSVRQRTATASSSVKKASLVLVFDDLTNPVELPLRVGAQNAASHFGSFMKIVGPSPATRKQQSPFRTLRSSTVTAK